MRTKCSGAPPRSHIVVAIISPKGRAETSPDTASSSKSGLERTSGTSSTRRYAHAPATAPHAARRGRLVRRSTGAVDLAGKSAPEDLLEPLRDADQRVEVDPRLDALTVEEEDE